MIHKRITFWGFLLLVSCVGIFACSKEDNTKNAAARLKVDKIHLSVIQSGRLSSGSKPMLTILANLGYEITSDVSWISTDKPIGKGQTDVLLDIQENTTGGIRTGHLTVSSNNLKEKVTIIQTMDLDTDDGQNVGFVYLEDDFGWCEEFGGEDEIEKQATGTTINANTVATAKAALNSRGYEDINSGGNCFYLGKHYFKMGKTNYQTGVRLAHIPNLEDGKTTNARLTFHATPVRTGSGNYDNVQVIVQIEGPGTVGGGSKKTSDEISIQIPNGGPWHWVERSVELFGIEAASKITLKTTKTGSDTGTFRWSLNDIKIEKIQTN
ncbi:BACON domain-containing protein [Sphingobacterium sp. SGR-19]|uniref:BACON domain-containing protein n=1 Tax=Sphingobacterium sp. SGR-19 TaxID=2710886 RepID=UPI0013EB7645|nr:BACON domain-containing protein [Sphingobacterium sp. SGR-19]NGM64868.1 BACON domain-containing protein [Sphingobacterium sp. SGR-19]